MLRSAVVIVDRDRVALIRRERRGQLPHYVFPGGRSEPGESPEDTAHREAFEELGVRVRLEGLLAVEVFDGRPRRYYRAVIVDGVFGTGQGEEMGSPAESARGTYTPVWLPLGDLITEAVYPRRLALLLAEGHAFTAPLDLSEGGMG